MDSLNYLSNTCDVIVSKINITQKKMFKVPTSTLIWLIIFIRSFISLISISMYLNSFLNPISIIITFLSFIIFIILIITSKKNEEKINRNKLNQEFVQHISKQLVDMNLYSLKQIDGLIEEINCNINYYDTNAYGAAKLP